MGVIRPPWVSKKWFDMTPFNYCDHSGDKDKLAAVCKICREEIERIERYRKKDKDPYDMKNSAITNFNTIFYYDRLN